jgi:hypothetical protein
MVMQALHSDKGRRYDSLEIERGGKTETYWFDITDYFGK